MDSGKRTMKIRIIFAVAVVLNAALIFFLSAQNGEKSAETSGLLIERLFGDLFTKLGINLSDIAVFAAIDHIIRKLAHFSEFLLEGFWLMLCLRVYTRHFVRHMSWPILGGVLTALTDETIQMFVPGRSSSVRDVWIDTAGVLAGLLVALLLLLIVRVVAAYAAVKKENRALRAERDRLLLAEREREHTRLARRAAHRAQQEETTQHEEEPQ